MTDTPTPRMADWTELANDIRRADGNHDLGAGALAEALIERGWTKAAAPDAGLRAAAQAMADDLEAAWQQLCDAAEAHDDEELHGAIGRLGIGARNAKEALAATPSPAPLDEP